jgi:SagB-type dehydrogenase family enzyme
MIPAVGRPSASAAKLASYWDEARLHVAHAKSASVRPAPGVVPWRTALEDVLKVGYGVQTQSRFVAGAWELIRWRTTPSAGALYPYEVIASVAGEGSYLWDVEKGRLVSCGLAPLTRGDLAQAGLFNGQHLEAMLILLARPWLSMKKYRSRGYAYCYLDVGHLASNLALYMAALGHTPTLHLRFSRAALADHLQLDGLCREPLAVLSFNAAKPAANPEPAACLEPAGLPLPDAPEIENWQALGSLLGVDLEPPCAPARSALVLEPAALDEDALLPLPEDRSRPLSARECRSAILARRSAKGFRDEPLSAAQVAALLGALRAESLPADCFQEGFPRLGVRLIARNVDGLAGVFAYAPRSHSLQRIAERAEDPRPACMQQEIAGRAAALLVFHAPVFRLFEEQGCSAFTELHFHAAQLGQRLHLAATRIESMGMTCIGGFDGEECAALARLDEDDEPVYVILLGVPDDSAFKHDRFRVAYSHGYTTVEG